MIQTVIIALPGLVALIICIVSGPKKAILNVYLPTLLLLPQYSWPISLQLSFVDVTLLAIVPFLLFDQPFKWQWCGLDFLVLTYLTLTVISFFINTNYDFQKTQNLAIHNLCALYLPYFVARRTMGHDSFRTAVAKRVCALLAAVAVVTVYEFKMGRDLFYLPFSGIFPGLSIFSFLHRKGFLRTSGPFGHPMAFGVIMAIGYTIVGGLEWNGVWREKLWRLPITKIRFCVWWILAGLGMSISYGDWIGAAIAKVTTSVCHAKNRKFAVTLLLFLLVTVATPIYSAWKAYTSVDWLATEFSGDKDRSDAAYRSELLKVYIPVVEERPAWGWGFDFPIQEGMASIDNGYLYTALMFGVYALAAWTAVLLWTPFRLCVLGVRLPRDHPAASTAFSLVALYIAIAFCNTEGAIPSNATLFGLFFFLTGWSASLLQHGAVESAKVDVADLGPVPQFSFERVML